MKTKGRYGFTKDLLGQAAIAAFRKLDPRVEAWNPVMFMVWIGSLLCTVVAIAGEAAGARVSGFSVQVIVWLWFTVLFANFAEGVAEVQGKARADSLRRMRSTGP
jgi:K+-transporting ATPase ATPase B chain